MNNNCVLCQLKMYSMYNNPLLRGLTIRVYRKRIKSVVIVFRAVKSFQKVIVSRQKTVNGANKRQRDGGKVDEIHRRHLVYINNSYSVHWKWRQSILKVIKQMKFEKKRIPSGNVKMDSFNGSGIKRRNSKIFVFGLLIMSDAKSSKKKKKSETYEYLQRYSL